MSSPGFEFGLLKEKNCELSIFNDVLIIKLKENRRFLALFHFGYLCWL